MSSSAQYKQITEEVVESADGAVSNREGASEDGTASLSSYASVVSVESIQISEKKSSSPQQANTRWDFSGFFKPRTVISFSAKNNALVQLNSSLDPAVPESGLDLHECVYNNDIARMKRIVDQLKKRNDKQRLAELLSNKDMHENTPLHLACMLGNLEMAKYLTANGAKVKVRNWAMWTPLNEAISFGNRDLVRVTLKKFEKEVEKIVDDAKPRIVEALKEMDDFYVEIKWDFESWIPFVSRFLPSDTCKLYKKGSRLRLDCTLGDITAGHGSSGAPGGQNRESAANSVGASISPFRWERGDLTFLFEIDKIGTKNSIVFMNNTKKTYLVIDKHQVIEPDIEREIDLLMAKEMIFVKLNTKQATFAPTLIGWFNKREKIEQLNGYLCQFFDMQSLFIVTKLRLEHLSDEELKKREEQQLKMKKQLTSGALVGTSSSDSYSDKQPGAEGDRSNEDDMRGLEEFKDLDDDIEYRPSLPAPPPNKIPWDEYIKAPIGSAPCIGRKQKIKESKKEFKAQIAMSQEFPLTVNDLNKLLDALVPLAKFRKLKEFINVKLPPGFPVKIDIPIVPAVAAKVCFQNFKKDCKHDETLFQIPKSFREEDLHSHCEDTK